MSNAPSDSRNPGQKRRRRNRGGQNRNNQGQNPNSRPQGQGQQGHGRQGSNQQDRAPRERRQPQPVKLTFWQKLLKAIGLYKEPVRPPRPERTERPDRGERPERAERGPREAREPRETREPRGERPVKANIRIARSDSPRKEFERGPVESPRLYVGNLSYDVSESDLSDLFKGIGGVRNVEIVYNRNTHRSKGYAFVEMLHFDDAKRAVEVFHDQPFMGRKMNVSGAKSKGQDEREDQEDREEQKPKPVVVAPLPPVVVAAPAAVAAVAETAPEVVEEVAVAVETPAEEAVAVVEEAPVPEVVAAVEEAPAAEKPAEAPTEVA